MKTALLAPLILSLSLGAHAAGAAPLDAKPLATIPSLDVKRYMGTWYEIAKFPNRFQKKCVGFTTAT